MARPKGSKDSDLTRKLLWMTDLLRRAREAGVEQMTIRQAARLVAQAGDQPDVLRAVASGSCALPEAAFDRVETLVAKDLAEKADRKAAVAIRRRRSDGRGPTAVKRVARMQKAARTKATASAQAERIKGLTGQESASGRLRTLKVAADALERAYRDRGRDLVTTSVDDLDWPSDKARYFPA